MAVADLTRAELATLIQEELRRSSLSVLVRQLQSPGVSGDAWAVGDMRVTSLGALPAGWLYANGGAVSRSTYAALHAAYAAEGYPYGAGNGSTTFNVPLVTDGLNWLVKT